MNCPADPEVLLEYADGRLDAPRARFIARHLETCNDCASAVQGFSAVADALDEWQAPPVSMNFNRRLWSRIEAAESAPWYLQVLDFLRFGSIKPLIPVAAAALAITAGFLMDHPYGMAPQPASRVSATEADQAERTLDDIQLLRQFDAAVSSPRPAKSM